MKAIVSTLLTCLVAACGSGPDPAVVTPAPSGSAADEPRGAVLEITVVSADIQGQMANGQHWDHDGQKSDVSPPILNRYLRQHPELDKTVKKLGIPVADPKLEKRASRSRAADPMVLIDIDGQVFRSPIRPRAFHPNWDFRFQVPVRDIARAVVRIQVVDYDGHKRFDSIGSTVFPAADLVRTPVFEVPRFGGVAKLILQTRPLPALGPGTAPASTRLAVPGRPTWTDTDIHIVAGQRVHISAADEVCTTLSNLSKCSGPEGQKDLNDYNHSGFKKVGHGTLIAALGDTRFPVGRDLRFVAPATGILRLGVNDTDTDNNKGSYAVQVVVHPVVLDADRGR